ncbi:MAG: polysaccharide biosynthesis protein [Candidatus Muirbacterium halophilum]|nr:polysaccharide biosynthesis protein [Candidatus Muirbacterium halophilum]MCK9474679.1 polysaccharide biosynthesis protein [Candidatus Muirbacterium halophilum]
MVIKTLLFFLADILAIFISYKFSENILGISFDNNIVLGIIVLKLIIFYFFRLYKIISKYFVAKDIMLIFYALTIISFIEYKITNSLKFSIINNNFLLILITFIRFLPKIIMNFKNKNKNASNILIYGAGDAGDTIMNEILKHPEYNLKIVGFIDDNKEKKGKYINNYKIYGDLSKVEYIINKTYADEVIIAIPSADSITVEKIYKTLSLTGVKVSILPAEAELIDGRVFLKDSRKFDINDILRRIPHERDLLGLRELIKDKNILVTGAGGSIGSELSRQIKNFKPQKLVLIGHGENSIFRLKKDSDFSHENVYFAIADIQDRQRLDLLIKKYNINIIFHAAAHKHVQLMEENPSEALKNNVEGSRNVFICASINNVEKVILISTDKAVEPISIMGMSKRIAEKLLFYYSNIYKNTNFISVRFGNVISSRGSVIPIFEEQIKKGGPVTVTHAEVERYFMSIPEAVQLTLESCINGKSGDIFVLDMGKPVKIAEIAKKMIEIYSPNNKIKILYTGLKDGEKLSEKLFSNKENPTKTENNKIFVMKHCNLEKDFYENVEELINTKDKLDENDIIIKLRELSI